MKKLLIAAAALVVAWPTLQSPARAETVLDRVLGGDQRQDNRDRQDIERNEDKIDHDRAEMRRDRREGDAAGVREEKQEINREESQIDRDQRNLSGSSRDPRERHHDDD
jgi:hypothetical protein